MTTVAPSHGHRRLRRTALIDEQVAEVFGVVRDPETRLLTFLLETACRREGLLDLTARSV
jgi:integrase/recombinase XerC